MGKSGGDRLFDFWAGFYNREPISFWLMRIQKKIVGQMPVSRMSSVLDVACGTGTALRLLSKKGVTALAGIDRSQAMLDRARMKVNASLKLASACMLPFERGKFDFVMSTEAFHHFPDPKKAVCEMARVAKPGGKVYIADINFGSSLIHWLFRKLEPGHIRIYSKQEFAGLFEEARLSVLEQKRIGLFVILTVGEKAAAHSVA